MLLAGVLEAPVGGTLAGVGVLGAEANCNRYKSRLTLGARCIQEFRTPRTLDA